MAVDSGNKRFWDSFHRSRTNRDFDCKENSRDGIYNGYCEWEAVKLVSLMNRMNCELEAIIFGSACMFSCFFFFFLEKNHIWVKYRMKWKTIKAPNTNSRRKRHRANHCVAEKEVYHHHLVVYSKLKAIGEVWYRSSG